MTHLERDWTSPVWRHWVEFLSQEHTLVRYDERGCGLSDREYPSLALENWVDDLEAVVDAAGVDRFSLFGASGGGPVAIAYAVRHPDRVTSLVLYGTYTHLSNCYVKLGVSGKSARAAAAARLATLDGGLGLAHM
jgi:pimeloyl-ACP methyl ester carboxylesterase